MLIYCDLALGQRLTGLTMVDKNGASFPVVPMSKDKHNELRDDAKFPSITWERLSRDYDQSRFENGQQVVTVKTPEGDDVVELYQMPNPYNIVYQVELIAKERYDADVLDDFFDSVIRPRGDTLGVKCHIDSPESDIVVKFPVFIQESKQLNDYSDPKNIYYRRVITLSVRLFIDPRVLESASYMIKNEVSVEELDNPII